MALKLKNKVHEFLKENYEKKFTAREIATWMLESYPDECREKQNRSTASINPLNSDTALLQQIASEIGSRRSHFQKNIPQIKTTEGRPRKYYYTQSSNITEINLAENNTSTFASDTNNSVKKEYDLYPILSVFLWSEFKIYSKRINEQCSRNSHGSGGNKWLHPDLVGLEDLSQDWHSEIENCVKQHSDKKSKLWSFEVKILINRSNIREAFFQAVSNSSWANLGYLVASEIQGDDTLKELRMLASLHGIGFIKLDIENPSESQIMIPATERKEIDWNIANRLTEENTDFFNYIKLVRKFYQTGEASTTHWDAVFQ